MEAAIGMIEVEGVAGIILATDASCKAAEVELLGWESTGGFTTVFFSGSVSAVAAALQSGEGAAKAHVEHVVAAQLTRPEPACRSYVTFPVEREAPVSSGALGLLETRGYATHVYVNDLMVKTADVAVVNVLTVYNRVVCTLIQGVVGAVQEALHAGRERASSSEHFLCSALIPQPVPEVLQAFGVRY